ncbi:type I glyceraldehyde-3-phosphate dehydrogenase [Aminicella lysinilytica]|uniref:type I glyceraldehyde-3-phosphate dehydrogenase n=1 Tax=Aminicella lysinilytica TaxID=433323 RepID=UPI001831158B|nr:type I glyceraldehyde-3-phosphate dehydrogenase [Aminicella lysinilytica]NLD10506.1 type I glyceraldehyde-3-phosphate dehydrogenase [Clostridiales bacterium]
MAIKVGISGFGRIGRVVIRAAMDMPEIEIAGINVRNSDIDYMVYMLKYDSTFGRFPKELGRYDDGLLIDGKKVPVYSEGEAKNIPWDRCGAEYIVEATGAYTTTEKAMDHITYGGAKKVIISAPAKDKTTPTFVYRVNSDNYTPDMDVVSNASCTTNCLAPLCKVVNDHFGIDQGLMSTIHSATAKQKVVDARSLKDWRTGRSVFGNIIPSTTGAAKAVGLVIPDLAGRMTGISYRVPTADVSVIDLNIMLKKSASYEDICRAVKNAADTDLHGVIEYVDDEVVSGDFVGDAHTSIFDAREGIELNDKFFKLIAYYDNEYGYSSKTLEIIKHMYEVDHR